MAWYSTFSDVKLLKAGCMQFRELFESKTGFNPFSKVTIASACSHDLRLNRMIKNSIASEPLHGWHASVNQSVGALEWLHWQDDQLGTAALATLSDEDLEAHDLMALAYPDYEHPSYRHYIQHGRNQGEFKIPETRYHADGYAKTPTQSTSTWVVIGMAVRHVFQNVANLTSDYSTAVCKMFTTRPKCVSIFSVRKGTI